MVDDIKAMVERPTPIYQRFAATFSNYCMRVLNHHGIFHFKVNNNGNLDHDISLATGRGRRHVERGIALNRIRLHTVCVNARERRRAEWHMLMAA